MRGHKNKWSVTGSYDNDGKINTQVLDYEFCYRVLKKNEIAIINSAKIKFRLHGLQTTVINKGNDSYAVDYKIYERIIYGQYSKYLSPKMRKSLTRKYNKWVHMFYSTIDVVKSIFR